MSDRDRSSRDRGSELDSRRPPRTSERAHPPSDRRRERADYGDEPFELPAWDAEQPRSGYRAGPERGGRDVVRRTERETSDRRSARNPLPTLGDAFQSPSRRTGEPVNDAVPARDRSPSQRPTRTPSRVSREARLDEEVGLDDPYGSAYLDDEGYAAPYPERERRSRRREPSSRVGAAPVRPPAARQFSGMLAAAGPQTRLVAIVSSFVIVSLVLMAATLLGRIGSLPEWIPIHLNAEGEPDRWGTNETLWRLPLMTIVFTLMCGVVAWYLRNRDAFGMRFMVMSAVLIHVTSWIAVVNFVW